MQRNGWSYGWRWKVLLQNKIKPCDFVLMLFLKKFRLSAHVQCGNHVWLVRQFSYGDTNWFGVFSRRSQYYTRFKSYCCEAYNILRKSSNLILNLFHLMAGSNIPDIASDPEKGILKVNSLNFHSDSTAFNSFCLWLVVYWYHAAPREVPVGLGRWSLYSFLPGSNKREC